MHIAFFSFIGFRKMRQAEATNWLGELEKNNLKTESYGQEYHWQDLHHLLIIPTFKEPVEILEQNLDAIAKQNYDRSKIIVLVCWEEKEGEAVLGMKEKILQKKFGSSFHKLFFTVHPVNYPGHHPGPGSNRTYALQQVLPELEKMGLDPRQIILTTLDADFVIHPNFLPGLTYKYLITSKAHKRTFTGVFWYYNNFWQAPLPNRLVASGVSFWQLAEMTGSSKYFNFSSHSINLRSLIDMGYWVVDKVNDDGEFYWRAYYHFAGDYKVIPHYISIVGDTVQAENLRASLHEQYLQLKRWAYGVEHIPMIFKQYFKRRDISFWDKTDKVLFLLRSYLTWSTLAIMITFGGWFLQMISPTFASTAVGFNLPYLSSLILTFAVAGMLLLVFVHESLVPPRPAEWGLIKRIASYVQWALVPLIILTYGTFPAIESQTRLMLGKHMWFRVTKKVRTGE